MLPFRLHSSTNLTGSQRCDGTQDIVVTGDAASALVIYPSPLVSTARRPQLGDRDLVQHVVLPRGAVLLCNMLDCMNFSRSRKVHYPEKVSTAHDTTLSVGAYLDVRKEDNESSKPTVFRVEQYRQLHTPGYFCVPPVPNICRPSLFVVEDSATGFENASSGMELFHTCKPQLVLYHMKLPLATGELWESLRPGAYDEAGNQDPDRIVVIVDSDDLEAEGIELNQYLSWERTCEDLVRYLGSNARLGTLATCAHLLVRFGINGVIHHQGRSESEPRLIVDPARTVGSTIESDSRKWKEHTTAFMAGLIVGLLNEPSMDLEGSVKLGIVTAQSFARMGLQAGNDGAPGYPSWKPLNSPLDDRPFAVASVPAARIVSSDNRSILEGATWSVLEDSTGSLHDLARKVVLEGLHRALGHVPVCQYSELILVDRTAIENFRALDETTGRYLATSPTRPLALAVFGTPGSGKTFAVTEFAKTMAKGRSKELVIFRLSQIGDSDQLHAAVEQINHLNYTGHLPVVLWEDFDSNLTKEPGLLELLVSYLDHGVCHSRHGKRSCGPGIWFFVSGRFGRLADFQKASTVTAGVATATAGDETASTSTAFLGSLQGYIDFRGPNQAMKTDGTFVVRRACLIRAFLEKRCPDVTRFQHFRVEDTVLDALLKLPNYRYGAKSLAAIVAGSKCSALTGLQRSGLPAEFLLSLHVDSDAFMVLVRSPRLTSELREAIARGLFEAYKAQRRVMAKSDGNEESLASDLSMCEWKVLKPELKESTRQQADDIPRKLRAIDCYMTHEYDGTANLATFSASELEKLAELEQERFNSERLQRHWRRGARHATSRTTPFIIPWEDLEQKWKDVNYASVKCVPGILSEAGFKIVPLD